MSSASAALEASAAALAPRVRHLAVRAPNWVGDLVMATPVLEAACADERFERVSIVLRAPLAPVLAGGPCEPALRAIERGTDELALWRELAPDAALLLPNSFGAAWRAWRARVPVRAGSALAGRRWLLTHAVVPPTDFGRRAPIPTAHLQRDAAGLLGIRPQGLRPRLYASAATRARVHERLQRLGLRAGEPYALCCPGAAFGSAKLWPPAHYARALDELARRAGVRAVVTGGPGEEAQIEAVVNGSTSGALSLAREPRDLEELKALVAGASLLLVGDSGPRWYAAAFEVPCVSVMGPNFPELTASSLEWCTIVRLEGLECSPCLERVCPLGHHRCMQELAPRRVVEAALELLERKRAALRSAEAGQRSRESQA